MAAKREWVPIKEHLLALREADAELNRVRFELSQLALAAALASTERATAAALAAAKEAVIKAEGAVDERLKLLNESRGTIQDLMTTLANKAETNFRFAALEKSVTELRDAVLAITNQKKGVGSVGTNIAIALAGFASLGSIVTTAILLLR